MDPETVQLAVAIRDDKHDIMVTASDTEWEIHAHSDKEDYGTTGVCNTFDPGDNFIFALHRVKDKFPNARPVIGETCVPQFFRGMSIAMKFYQQYESESSKYQGTPDYSKLTAEEWANDIIDQVDMHWLVPPDDSTFSYEVTEGLAYAPLDSKIEDVIECIKQKGYNVTWERKEYSGQKIISIKFTWRPKK